ncbi:MAG: type II toxin-antitoxin system RelE/ParE family toxin [candidate division Zixibacteria bacterium]|nr:type II toxin-antitoxin system RelE/ParE family toxin [candidate division Zixibacteria bacterium]
MKIYFEESFEKDLRKVKDKSLLKRVKETINEVRSSKGLREIKGLEKLKSYKTFYRIRAGDYRIGVEIVNDKIIFTRFLHRKDIYKYFP